MRAAYPIPGLGMILLAALPAAPAWGGDPPAVGIGAAIAPGGDPCRPGAGGDIVVCGRRRDAERYRIPRELREAERAPPAEDVQARLGPSALCQQGGNALCGRAAIPVIFVKDGRTRIGPVRP